MTKTRSARWERTATGVRGIKLADGDYVIGAARARKDAYVLSVTENGYGKRTPVEEFTVHHRGRRRRHAA